MSIGQGEIEPPGLADRLRFWALVGIGIGSALLYGLGITARYPLWVGLRSVRAGWSTLADKSLLVGLEIAGIAALLIVGYVLALRLALRLRGRRARRAVGVVLAGWLLSSAALLGAYPGESFDVFDYVFRGRMIVEYGASPLATAPFVFQDQPFFSYITWRGQVDTYGPLWEYASGAVAWLVHYAFGYSDSFAAYILGYRLMAVALAGVCGLLIALIVRQSAPQLLPAALLAWLWNPLVLISSAMGAHNDLLMSVALLAALLLAQRRRWVWGLLALALAAHVKLTALLVLPVLGLWMLRRCGWARTLRSCALALALALPISWLLYAPFGGWATLRRMLQERARLLINSPADLVYRLLQEHWGWSEPAAWRASTQAATLAFFAIAAGILAWFWWADRRAAQQKLPESHAKPQSRQGHMIFAFLAPLREPFQTASHIPEASSTSEARDELLWRAAIGVTLAYLLVGSFWFQHWYLLWALAPAALLPDSRWTLTLLPAYCLGAFWSNLANSFARGQPSFPLNDTQVAAINTFAQVLPLLCVLLAMRLWHAAPRLLAAARRERTASQAILARTAVQEVDQRP